MPPAGTKKRYKPLPYPEEIEIARHVGDRGARILEYALGLLHNNLTSEAEYVFTDANEAPPTEKELFHLARQLGLEDF